MKAIMTAYHGPTDTRGSRITARDEDGNRASVSYPYSANRGEAAHRVAAVALCQKMGWTGNMVAGAYKGGFAFVFVE